jgi:hypothetical protein
VFVQVDGLIHACACGSCILDKFYLSPIIFISALTLPEALHWGIVFAKRRHGGSHKKEVSAPIMCSKAADMKK